MKIENQVCSLEQAKRLKELGVVQHSAFYHYKQIVNGVSEVRIYPLFHEDFGRHAKNESLDRALSGDSKNEIYSAFTIAELGIILPHNFISHRHDPKVSDNYWVVKLDYNSECDVCAQAHPTIHFNSESQTESCSRAAMLIYLLENGTVTADDVNATLLTS